MLGRSRGASSPAGRGSELLQHPPYQQWQQNLVVSGQEEPGATAPRGTLHHVQPRPVVTLHIEISRSKVGGTPSTQIPRNGQRLQKHFGQYHRAPPVQHHTTLIEVGNRGSQPAEVPVAGRAERGTITARMLMDDFCPDRGMYGDRDVVACTRDQDRGFRARKISAIDERAG